MSQFNTPPPLSNGVPPNSSMKPFYVEVVKAFAEHSGPDEIIRYHLPETHGHEPLHSQFTLINKTTKSSFKIKFDE